MFRYSTSRLEDLGAWGMPNVHEDTYHLACLFGTRGSVWQQTWQQRAPTGSPDKNVCPLGSWHDAALSLQNPVSRARAFRGR